MWACACKQVNIKWKSPTAMIFMTGQHLGIQMPMFKHKNFNIKIFVRNWKAIHLNINDYCCCMGKWQSMWGCHLFSHFRCVQQLNIVQLFSFLPSAICTIFFALCVFPPNSKLLSLEIAITNKNWYSLLHRRVFTFFE